MIGLKTPRDNFTFTFTQNLANILCFLISPTEVVYKVFETS
jgi:hypothetical protein